MSTSHPWDHWGLERHCLTLNDKRRRAQHATTRCENSSITLYNYTSHEMDCVTLHLHRITLHYITFHHYISSLRFIITFHHHTSSSLHIIIYISSSLHFIITFHHHLPPRHMPSIPSQATSLPYRKAEGSAGAGSSLRSRVSCRLSRSRTDSAGAGSAGAGSAGAGDSNCAEQGKRGKGTEASERVSE